MKTLKKRLSLMLCAIALLSLPALAANEALPTQTDASSAEESTAPTATEWAPTRVWGKVTKLESGSLELKNDDENDPNREIILHLSESTVCIDAVTGMPLDLDAVKDGDTLYAWIGPAVTMSLPPQSTALAVVGNIPADYSVPSYYEISGVDLSVVAAIYPPPERTEVNLPVRGGETLKIPVSAEVSPYLTKNIVTLDNLIPGSHIFVWRDSDNEINRVLLLPYSYRGYFTVGENGEMFVNGEKLSVNGKVSDTSKLLPLRAAAEAMGYEVSWVKGQGAVVKNAGETVFSVLPGAETVVLSGEEDPWTLMAPCVVENGVTYLSDFDLAYLLNLYQY